MAEDLRKEGNEYFQQGKYTKAIEAYTKALDLEPTMVPALSNRSFAYLKLELPGAALVDANAAIEVDPNYIKAYYRKASAHLQMGKHKEALKDLKVVVQLHPDDVDAKKKFNECDKVCKRIAFEKAIVNGDSVPMSEKIKPNSIPIPATFSGPVMAESGIDAEFVEKAVDEMEREGKLCKRDVCRLLLAAKTLLESYPNIVPVPLEDSQEFTVCGDVHGQYYDLLNIWKLNGRPSPSNPYLFNGDFVDRGSYSAEVIIALLCYKVLYPNALYLSRGNHEGINMNRVYGFEGEIKAKYDEQVYQLFQEVFNALPLGHVLNKKVFVVHGGLFSKDNVTIDDINKVNRIRDIAEDGLMCEVLWADPQPFPGRSPSKRGTGVSFGPDVTDNFLKTNNLELVVRSHEVKDEGYEVMHNGKLITVFSAPNYCDQMGNKGAFIRFKGSDMKPKFTTFSHVAHKGKPAMAYSSMMGF